MKPTTSTKGLSAFLSHKKVPCVSKSGRLSRQVDTPSRCSGRILCSPTGLKKKKIYAVKYRQLGVNKLANSVPMGVHALGIQLIFKRYGCGLNLTATNQVISDSAYSKRQYEFTWLRWNLLRSRGIHFLAWKKQQEIKMHHIQPNRFRWWNPPFNLCSYPSSLSFSDLKLFYINEPCTLCGFRKIGSFQEKSI